MTTTPVALARERAGISVRDLAAAVGINEPSCWDLMSQPSEVYMCLTLRQVLRLASTLREPVISLVPDPPAPARAHYTLQRLADAIRDFCGRRGFTVEQFSENAGWDVHRFVDSPDSAFDDWCLDTLRHVCHALDLHWPEFLPDATSVV